MLLGLILINLGCITESTDEARNNARATQDGGVEAPEAAAGPPIQVAELAINRPAPALSLARVDGGPRWTLGASLDPRDKSSPRALLLVWTSIGCAPCIEALTVLATVERAQPELEIVLISVDDDPVNQRGLLTRVRDAGLSGPVLLGDAASRAVWGADTASLPRQVFVNRVGLVVGVSERFSQTTEKLLLDRAARAVGRGVARADPPGDNNPPLP